MSEAEKPGAHNSFSDPSASPQSGLEPGQKQLLKTVLIVEDSAIDRELYRRYLTQSLDQSYQIQEADCGETALKLCRHSPDVVLLDNRLPDADGLEFLSALQALVPDPPPVIVVTGQGNESIAVQLLKAGAEDYLVKGRLSAEELQHAVQSAIEKSELQRKIRQVEADRQQHIGKERIINQISQQVLRSLDLDEILQMTVQEVRQFLQTDRVVIFTFESDLEAGKVVAEAIVPPWTKVMSSTFRDSCFHRDYAKAYEQGRIMNRADIRTAGLEPCHLEFLESLQVRANLVVPILQKEKLWGLLIAQHCAAPREWKPTDIELLRQLATQVGIAIQQADAYADLASWNTRLLRLNEEMQAMLEELQVAEEELRVQHEQLEHEQNRYEDLFNFAPDGYLITDSKGQIQEANQAIADLLNLQPRFLLGQPLAAHLATAEGRQLLYARLNDPDRFRQVQTWELQFRSQKSRAFPAEIRTTGIYSSSGQLLGLRWLIRDITERKQAEAERERLLCQEQAARNEAENANRVKDEFLAVLSHELRSPLNPILGWTTLLQSQKLSPEKTKTAMEAIDRNARLQAQLIEDLLDISRIMSGKLTLTAAPVNLASVLTAALETVHLAAKTKSIQLDLSIDPDVGFISGDATRLQQVIWNLLSNAIKFTPSGGRVTVKLEQVERERVDESFGEAHEPWMSGRVDERVGQRNRDKALEGINATPTPQTLSPSTPPLLYPFVQLTITDTGKGIHPNFLPYVFEYFRQEDASTTRRFGGLGLGMSIARQIVEMHGGAIAAASLGEGQGATFTVRLPLLLQESLLSEAIEDGELISFEAAPLAGVRVLIVDDEPDAREFLTFLLQDEGATVTEAACAADVLQTMEQFSPDIIVSDIGMPDIDGYMLMQRVRASQQTRFIPAIALTAYASESDQQQALAAGFQRHATKPIDPSQVIALIRELIQSE